MHKMGIVLLLISITVVLSCTPQNKSPALQGEYLGQSPPGDDPVLFAPGIISTGMNERDIAITSQGDEIYFTISLGRSVYAIAVCRSDNGIWTQPEIAPFSGRKGIQDLEPFISPDGGKFYFVSDRPISEGEKKGNMDIWVMDLTETGWGEPYNIGAPVNSELGDFFPSVTKDGTLYFTRNEKGGSTAVYRSRLAEGKYTDPERLGETVNSTRGVYNVFISPDEDYLIAPIFGREDSLGGTDYYIIFRDPDDTWHEPINLGEKINTKFNFEWSPYVTRDGKYFFFMSDRVAQEKPETQLTYKTLTDQYNRPQNGNTDIYWVSASFIQKLRTENR